MRAFLNLKFAAIIVALTVAGCGRSKSGGPTASERQSFDNAPPELKQAWEKAGEADKANDYVAAETLLYALVRQPLSPPQKAAVEKELTAVNQRLLEAAQKGDTTAKAALEELRHNPPNRQR